ncbi:hypothetical protein PGT21_005736 [Puccinia graminis f. sp. tritici]|uniref:Cell wall mannoprotein 1 n=2 Tax=Puccinia graminis f. sp. tritici TaxID=56615 RepID=E3KB89_PUCGT|nr:uncharacterized protein PGTG_07851 [Puccinia graminis f. sp. tritici CRL 75-36-700-3]EFP81602.1 hypothetical protein PGTG_07851 [Puccinia graminis f. sp. tritici CRL 75-36-700-3]KAA1109987.1 hypothetical protein PGT21_005736 [Puccinia graminis f. sp. tritici]
MYSSSKVLLMLSAIVSLATQLVSVSAFEPMTNEDLEERQPHHLLQARQAPAPKREEPKAVNPGQPPKPDDKSNNPAEASAGNLIGMLLLTSEALDAVTHMGSNATTVKLGSEAIIKMLPDLKAGRQKVLKDANKNGVDDDLEKKISAAAESMNQMLKDISAKPEDANAIKAKFASLVDSFNQVINVSEATINLALPAKAAEFEKAKLEGGLKKEEQAAAAAGGGKPPAKKEEPKGQPPAKKEDPKGPAPKP